ncbi:MAG TPA: hypothetical protein VGO43_01630 [Pyrinomonadaceae bacterium]|jgi:hypothetical protein|nr:hypothetical protein [Pyrinomonadaceae bacterium]
MKRNFVLAAALAFTAMAISASAQKTTDFSGTWTLEVAKSNPAETMIESQTMTVTQTAADIKVDRSTKVKPMPEGSAPNGGPGSGRGMGGPGGGGPQTYGLKDAVKVSRDTPNGPVELSFSAKIEGNKLTLTTTSPMGSRGETWTLNADGTLTSESQGRNGSVTRTYTKKS